MAGLSRSLRLQYVRKFVNNPSTLAGECTPAPPPFLVSQVRSAAVHMHFLRKGRSACLLLTRRSAPLWRSPVVNNNSEECKSHSGHVQVHAQNVSTMGPPPWHATPDGQWHAKCIRPARSLLLERYFPNLAVHNGRGFSIQPTESACPCCVLYTHSRAAKRPLAASLPATPALGHRRCLIVFTVFRGAANDPEMFSVADR